MKALALSAMFLGALLLVERPASADLLATKGKISMGYTVRIAKEHTADLLHHSKFGLKHLWSGKDKLATEHFLAVPSAGAKFKPFQVNVLRAKLVNKVIAPAGHSRVSFSAYTKKR